MGVSINAQKDQNKDYVQAVLKYVINQRFNKIKFLFECIYRASMFVAERMLNPFIWNDFIYKLTRDGKEFHKSVNVMSDFAKDIIEERQREFDESNYENENKSAFLDLLLNTKKQNPNLITLENILEEVETFMFAGHDTTSATLSWTCQMIGSHPDVQKKLHEEIDSVFGDSDRPVRYEDLKDLTYLENVIKETLRVHSSVPFIARSLSSDVEVGN